MEKTKRIPGKVSVIIENPTFESDGDDASLDGKPLEISLYGTSLLKKDGMVVFSAKGHKIHRPYKGRRDRVATVPYASVKMAGASVVVSTKSKSLQKRIAYHLRGGYSENKNRRGEKQNTFGYDELVKLSKEL